MKYLKMIGLAAAASLMAVVGATTASATQLDKVTAGGVIDPIVVGDTIDASATAGTTLNLTDTAGNPIDTCKEGTWNGKVTNAGGAASTVVVGLTSVTWNGCTQTTTTIALGELEIHTIVGTDNGTVTGKNTVWTTNVFGVSCRYGTGAGTHLGELTGVTSSTQHAILHINANILEQEPKQFLCPDSGRWVGTFTFATPTGLYVTP